MVQTKEVTEMLGIDRERIKYYKKMGVFKSKSDRPGWYTETDVYNLRRLVVLGVAGLTCDDIKRVQTGEQPLESTIRNRRKKIHEKMKQMMASLELSDEMLGCGIQYESMQTDYYWNVISLKKNAGEEYYDPYYEESVISMIRTFECPHCHQEQAVDLEDFLCDESSDEKENGMGPDMVYSFDSDESYECEYCGRIFKIEGWIREYPIGAYDSEAFSVEEIAGEEEHDDE